MSLATTRLTVFLCGAALTFTTALQAQTLTGSDIAAIASSVGVRSDAFVQHDATARTLWRNTVGNGTQYGFLSGNFDGQGTPQSGRDDIAAICFNPQPRGNGHVFVTAAPGSTAGSVWQRALGPVSQNTFYIDRGDFNGDGIADIATFYQGATGDLSRDVRAKITYGPTGSVQTRNPNGNRETGSGVDWLFAARYGSAFLPADFIGNDGIDDIAVVSRQGNNLSATFIQGPTGSTSGISCPLGGGTLAALRAANFSGDAKPEIGVLTLNQSSGQYQFVSVTVPNCATSAPRAVVLPSGAAPKNVLPGDFDNDGRGDLAIVYTTTAGNFAQLLFNPESNRNSETLPLRSDSTKQFAFAAGEFGSPGSDVNTNSCNGTVDSCGVCNGDGTSCRQCSSTDVSDLISALTREFILLRDLERRQWTILRSVTPRSNKALQRRISLKLKSLDTRYDQFIGDIYATISPVIKNCPSSNFCSQIDNQPLLTRYQGTADAFLSGTVESVRLLKRNKSSTAKRNYRNADKRVVRTRSVHATATGRLAQIPKTASSCR